MPREKKHTGLYKGPGAEALRTTIGAAGEVTQVAGAAGLNIFGASIGAVRNVLSTITGGETQPLSDFMTAKITRRDVAKTKAAAERNISVGQVNAAKRIAEAPRSVHSDKQLEYPGQGKGPKARELWPVRTGGKDPEKERAVRRVQLGQSHPARFWTDSTTGPNLSEPKGPKATAAPTAASSATPFQRPDYIDGKRNYYPEPTPPGGRIASGRDNARRIYDEAVKAGALTPAGTDRATYTPPTFEEHQAGKRFGTVRTPLRQTPTEGTGQWQGGPLDMPSGGGRASGSKPPRELWPVLTGEKAPEIRKEKGPETPYRQRVEELFESTRAQELINQMRKENLIKETKTDKLIQGTRVDDLIQDTKIQKLLKEAKIQKAVNATPKKKKKKK